MAVFNNKITRIFDANLNRGIEGLRVIEEIARLAGALADKIEPVISEIADN